MEILERVMQFFSDFSFTDFRFTLWCLRKFRYYIVFSKAILFILGLAFNYSVVERALFSILITHLADWWKHQHLPKFAIVVNLHEGIYELLQIFFAYAADAYTGLYTMIVCSTIVYIIGLCLFYTTTGLGLFYPALVLVTLSHAAENVTLESFLDDQLLARDKPTKGEEEERAFSRAKFWWNSVALLAVIVAFFGPSQIDDFNMLSLVSAIGMGVGFFWFLLGTKFYRRAKPAGSPLGDVAYVIYMALIPNRNAEYQQQILPHVPWLRWLDRAAVQEQPGGSRCCDVEQVKEVKFLLKMLPIWTTFLTFSLVSSTGSTFFLEEAINIDDEFPVLFFIILERFTNTMVAEVSDYALEKLGKKMKNFKHRLMLLRIGIGMACCVLCCIVACINSLHWLHLVKNYREQAHRHMSVFRLIPQYFLLGVMEGLSEDGLENFFDSQVSKSIARYGAPFGEFVMGIGKFLSVLCILIFSKWFKWIKNDIDSSRLYKYYVVLAVLSFLNLIIYWMVAYWYKDDRFLANQLDAEVGQPSQALQEYYLGSPVLQSSSNKGQYSSGRSLPSKILPIPEDSTFGDDPTEKQEDSRPLLQIGQETVSSSSGSAVDGRLNAQQLSVSRSFARPSSRGIQKRSHSIH